MCLFYLFTFAIICICKTRILGLKEKLPKKETTWKPKYSRVQPQCTNVFLAHIVLSLRQQKVPLRGRSKMTKSQANCLQVSWLCLHSSSSQEGNLTKMAAELPYISDAWQWQIIESVPCHNYRKIPFSCFVFLIILPEKAWLHYKVEIK